MREQPWRQGESRGRVFGVTADAAIRVAGEVEVAVHRRALGRAIEIDARLAHTLHGDEGDHHARPVHADGASAAAAPTALATGGEHGAVLSPLAGKRADVVRLQLALLSRPVGGLRHAVGLTEDVLGPLLKALGVRRYVFLVIRAFGEPHIGDGSSQRRVRTQLRAEPFAAAERVRVVVVRVDEDELDAQFLQPLPAHRAFESAVDATGRLRVARPPHDHFAILDAIDEPVGLLGIAEPGTVPPHVDRAPMPTVPAVRVVVDHGSPDGVHEAGQQGMSVIHKPPGMVRGTLDHY